MDNKTPLLDIQGLVTTFFTRAGALNAVDGIDLQVHPGEAVALVGESGCGKSMTALSAMGLIKHPGKVTGGKILFKDDNLLTLRERALRRLTGDRISMIFQEPMTSLNPVKTVGHQVREAILLHSDLSREAAKSRVLEIFDSVGIAQAEVRYACYPHQLSGGLRQRVMIGMAMALNPDLLIADEPTTALDVTIEAQILRLMRTLRKTHNTAVLMITHNLGVVAELCDTVYVMYAGQVVERADVHSLFESPKHPYTLGLLNSLPRMNAENATRLNSIPGMVPSLLNLPVGCRFSPRCDRAQARCFQEAPPLLDLGGRAARCFCLEES